MQEPSCEVMFKNLLAARSVPPHPHFTQMTAKVVYSCTVVSSLMVSGGANFYNKVDGLEKKQTKLSLIMRSPVNVSQISQQQQSHWAIYRVHSQDIRQCQRTLEGRMDLE